MPELKLEGVTKRFKQKEAVKNVSMNLTEGVYGFLGENGAGKTTLLRMLCGVLRPTEGMITCDNVDIRTLDGEYRHMLGYLPQDFGYYPDFTAKRYLNYLAACKALPRETAASKTLEYMELVGLEEHQNQKIKTFSGGMLRRLGIAQALLNEPEILILDEPTSGLDPRERIRFRNIISSLSKDRIVILSTHIVSDVEYIADEIMLMKSGRILCQGRMDAITKAAEGKVWECTVSQQESERLNDEFAICNLRNVESGVHLRIVAEECPVKGARPVEPGLEDAYLYYTGGERE